MKSWKKLTALVLSTALLAGALAACGGEPTASKDPAVSPKTTASTSPAPSTGGKYDMTGPVDLTFAAQEVGTAAYTCATAVQTVLMNGLPEGSNINITTTSPGGVGAPIIVNGAAQCDLVVGNAGPAQWSCEDGILDNPPTAEVRAIAGGLGQAFTNVMFTQKFVDETGITTMEELVARKYPVKMVIKKNGSLGEMTAEKVLEALGVTMADIESWGGKVEKTGGDAIKSGLQDDIYDMTIDHIGAGQANTTELCLTHDMYDVQLGDETMAKMVEMGYDYLTVEANTWNGQTEPIKTVGSQQVLLVSATMDDATAYHITKALCEGYEDLVAADGTMRFFDPATAGTAPLTGAPLHPGAIAYYEEMGYPHA